MIILTMLGVHVNFVHLLHVMYIPDIPSVPGTCESRQRETPCQEEDCPTTDRSGSGDGEKKTQVWRGGTATT